MGDGVDIFISYAHKDNNDKKITQLHGELVKAGYKVWMDHQIEPSDIFVDKIDDALSECKLLLLILSVTSRDSPWVKGEWQKALDRDCPILIYRIDNTSLPYPLNIRQYLPAPANWNAGIPNVISEIEKLLKTGLLPGPLPGYLVDNERGKKYGRRAFTILTMLLVVLSFTQCIASTRSFHISPEQTSQVILHKLWIVYEPSSYDPEFAPNPDIELIREELGWIANTGFDGIITITSQNNFGQIPRIASEYDLDVIMGIWDPTNTEEIQRAIEQSEYVVAYSVGHNGLGQNYSYEALEDTILNIRRRTGLPVSTTERISSYLSNESLLTIGDWLFPDVHLSFRDGDDFVANPDVNVEETFDLIELISNQVTQSNYPILLKMILYPASGISDASVASQQAYYTRLLEGRRDSLSPIPTNAEIAFGSSFDQPWKQRFGWPFYQWDAYTGLFELDGTPRPATTVITERRS